MAKVFGFDEDDANVVRRMINDYRRRNRSAQLEPGEALPAFPPEVHVAKTPSGGIPARSGRVPGTATCNIYKLIKRDVYPTISLEATHFNKLVNNISDIEIAGDIYKLVWRDKYGDWVTETGPCACCYTCDIYETNFNIEELLDDFTVYNDSSPSAVSLEVIDLGTTNNVLSIAGSADTSVEVIANTPHPVLPYASKVTVDVMGGPDSIIRVILSASDTDTGTATGTGSTLNDAIIVEFRADNSCSEMRIYQRSGGEETLLAGPLSVPRGHPNIWHRISACYNPIDSSIRVNFIPYVTYGGNQEIFEMTAFAVDHPNGPLAGVGTQRDQTGTATLNMGTGTGTDSGDIYFDNFDYDILWYYAGDATFTEESGTGTGSPPDPVRTLTIDATYGKYWFTWRGSDSVMLDYDAYLGEIQSALAGLLWGTTPTISATGSNPYTITFENLSEEEVNDIELETICLQSECEGEDYSPDCEIVWCDTCQEAAICDWIYAHFDDEDAGDCEWDGYEDWDMNVSGGYLYTTESSTTLLHKNSYPWNNRPDDSLMTQLEYSHNHRHHTQLAVRCSEPGTVVRSIVAALDEDNYVACEVTVSGTGTGTGTNSGSVWCAEVKIIDVTAGVSVDVSPVHIMRGIREDESFYISVRYADGEVKALVGSPPNGFVDYQASAQNFIGAYPDDTYYFRSFRSNDSNVTYHGDRVGVSISGNGGEVRLLEFEAGCNWFSEHCKIEEDDFSYGWNQYDDQECFWDLFSGDWPELIPGINPYLKVVEGNSLRMLCKNPVTADAEDYHKVLATFRDFDGWVGFDGKVAVIFGSDATATDYYKAEYDSATARISVIEVNSGVETELDYLDVPSTHYEMTITGCIIGDTVSAFRTTTVLGSSTTYRVVEPGSGSHGPYCGIEVTPATSGSSTSDDNDIIFKQFEIWRTTSEELNPLFPVSPQLQRCNPCGGECNEFCIDSNWPGSFAVEVDGFTLGTYGDLETIDPYYWNNANLEEVIESCSCDDLNGTYYPYYQGSEPCYNSMSVKKWESDCTDNTCCSGYVRCGVGLVSGYKINWLSSESFPKPSSYGFLRYAPIVSHIYDMTPTGGDIPDNDAFLIAYVGMVCYGSAQSHMNYWFIKKLIEAPTSPIDCTIINEEMNELGITYGNCYPLCIHGTWSGSPGWYVDDFDFDGATMRVTAL